ncbi:MAG: 3'-5' exonuclease [Nitrosarchaeum sp.]
MNYDDLQKTVIGSMRENKTLDRIISLDIEADLRTFENPQQPILSISTARRIDGKINIQKFILEDETSDAEVKIFNEFGSFCQEVKPLVIVGYASSVFDLPMLMLKMRTLDNQFKKDSRYQPGYWALRDTLGKCFSLDVFDPVRFEIARVENSSPKFMPLEKTLSHKRFEHLPFMRTKNVVSDMTNNGMNKWDAIHNLWRDKRESFNQYIEGDVHDTLLLAEDLFNINSS